MDIHDPAEQGIVGGFVRLLPTAPAQIASDGDDRSEVCVLHSPGQRLADHLQNQLERSFTGAGIFAQALSDLRVAFHVLPDDRREDVLLVVEVVVDRRPGDLCGPGDVAHRGLREAPAGEQLAARLKDLRPRTRLTSSWTSHFWPLPRRLVSPFTQARLSNRCDVTIPNALLREAHTSACGHPTASASSTPGSWERCPVSYADAEGGRPRALPSRAPPAHEQTVRSFRQLSQGFARAPSRKRSSRRYMAS